MTKLNVIEAKVYRKFRTYNVSNPIKTRSDLKKFMDTLTLEEKKAALALQKRGLTIINFKVNEAIKRVATAAKKREVSRAVQEKKKSNFWLLPAAAGLIGAILLSR